MLICMNITKDERTKLEALYICHRDKMFKTAMGILRDGQLAEDAVHDAFMRIAKNLHKIDSEQSKKTCAYMNIITRNLAISKYNQRIGLGEVQIDTLYDEPSCEKSYGELFEGLETEFILEKIGQLSDKYQELIFLKLNHGLSYREISDTLNISEELVRKRTERARAKLAKLLEVKEYA